MPDRDTPAGEDLIEALKGAKHFVPFAGTYGPFVLRADQTDGCGIPAIRHPAARGRGPGGEVGVRS
jgi:hypothetical protein